MRWSKIYLISKYEFFRRIRKPVFYIMILALLVLYVIVILILSLMIFEMVETYQSPIGVVDHSRLLPTPFLEEKKQFLVYSSVEDARAALRDRQIEAFVEIPSNYLESGQVLIWVSGNSWTLSLILERTESFLRAILIQNRLDPRIASRVVEPIDDWWIIDADQVGSRLQDEVLTGPVAQRQQTAKFFIQRISKVALIFIILWNISTGLIFGYEDISRDANNRMGELMLSAVRATEWFVGKILGVVSVILVQTLIQIMPVLGIFGWISWRLLGDPTLFSVQEISLGVVYFLIGVLFYVSIIMFSIILHRKIAVWISSVLGVLNLMASIVMIAPSTQIAIFLSFFPFTSPATMLVRVMLRSASLRDVVISLIVVGICLMVTIKIGSAVASRALIPGMPLLSISRPQRRR